MSERGDEEAAYRLATRGSVNQTQRKVKEKKVKEKVRERCPQCQGLGLKKIFNWNKWPKDSQL